MLFRWLADLVLVAHAAFVAFVALGALLVLRWRKLAWVHLPAAVWGIVIEFAGWVCPLTPLENALRVRGGGSAYGGDFIEHYVKTLLYPAGLTRRAQIALGLLALGVNLLIYWRVAVAWRRAMRLRRAGPPSRA